MQCIREGNIPLALDISPFAIRLRCLSESFKFFSPKNALQLLSIIQAHAPQIILEDKNKQLPQHPSRFSFVFSFIPCRTSAVGLQLVVSLKVSFITHSKEFYKYYFTTN